VIFRSTPTLESYRELFLRTGMLRFAVNSLLLATAVTAFSLTLSTLAGYAFAKLDFAGRDRIFQTLIGAVVIPGQVALMPLL
jgi:multiple sugar transport system permease protein